MRKQSIQITISDPWEIGEAVDWRGVSGDLLRVDKTVQGEIGLVVLGDGIRHEKRRWIYLAVVPRNAEKSFANAREERSVPCNFIGLEDLPGESELLSAVRLWRGGLAFVGDMSIAVADRD